MAKSIRQVQYTKRIKTEVNGDKDRKAFWNLMNNTVYGEIMENWRNRTDVILVSNEKEYLK